MTSPDQATRLIVDGLRPLSCEGSWERLTHAGLRRPSYCRVTAAAGRGRSAFIRRRRPQSDVKALGTSLVTLHRHVKKTLQPLIASEKQPHMHDVFLTCSGRCTSQLACQVGAAEPSAQMTSNRA